MGTPPPRTEGSPTSPPLPDGRLETFQRSHARRGRAVHARREDSGATRRNAQMTNPPQKSRYTNQRTSGSRPHDRSSGKTFLVARPQEMDGRICPRVRHMSTEQDTHTPTKDSVLPHIDQRRNPSLPDGGNGSHHKPSTQPRK